MKKYLVFLVGNILSLVMLALIGFKAFVPGGFLSGLVLTLLIYRVKSPQEYRFSLQATLLMISMVLCIALGVSLLSKGFCFILALIQITPAVCVSTTWGLIASTSLTLILGTLIALLILAPYFFTKR